MPDGPASPDITVNHASPTAVLDRPTVAQPETANQPAGEKHSLRKRIAEQLQVNPDTPLETLVDMDDATILSLSPNEYLDYLHVLRLPGLPPSAIVKHMDTITTRYERDLIHFGESPNLEERHQALKIGEGTEKLLWDMGHHQVVLPKEILERYYSFIKSPHQRLALEAIETVTHLAIFDRRLPESERIGIMERFKNDYIQQLSNVDTPFDREKAKYMTDVVWADWGHEVLVPYMTEAFNNAQTPKARAYITRNLTNRVGLAEARQYLFRAAESNPQMQQLLEEAFALSPAQTNFAQNMEEFYGEKFDLRTYRPNVELLQKQTDLLKKELTDKEAIIEIACGTGEQLAALAQDGIVVTDAYDYVKTNVDAAQNQAPKTHVQVASWHKTPYEDGQFDSAYCVGRSFLHNATVNSGIEFLRETNRILKKDGVLIIDTPDPDMGIYLRERERIEAAADAQGIEHFEAGFIIDSPDGVNYCDRLVPLPDQFKAMAKVSGFKAEIIQTREYEDAHGEKNKNYYWKLTKVEIDWGDFFETQGNLRTTGPSLSMSYV